ncbi:MAG: type VI secretion system-associated protein TagF [Tateyamaria sp.]|uniref:type VI secretion system-associated protein TagF n=1 Tax=Tateyamaria sp. TaxID=1929288 RepID=UPI0032846B8C
MSQGFGAFGKIPGMGDFLRVNLPSGFIQPWDTWLQTSLLDIRNQLGEGWNDAYLSAPIWRFTLPAGLAGAQCVTGILMASVDRVGRQYPLTLAALHDAPNTVMSHYANGAVFQQLETIALNALEDHATRGSLTTALAGVSVAPSSAPMPTSLPYAGTVPFSKAVAVQTLTQSVGAASALWSTQMQDDYRMRATPGLPEGRALRSLFDLSPALWNASSVMDTI